MCKWYLGNTHLKKQVVGWRTVSRFCVKQGSVVDVLPPSLSLCPVLPIQNTCIQRLHLRTKLQYLHISSYLWHVRMLHAASPHVMVEVFSSSLSQVQWPATANPQSQPPSPGLPHRFRWFSTKWKQPAWTNDWPNRPTQATGRHSGHMHCWKAPHWWSFHCFHENPLQVQRGHFQSLSPH